MLKWDWLFFFIVAAFLFVQQRVALGMLQSNEHNKNVEGELCCVWCPGEKVDTNVSIQQSWYWPLPTPSLEIESPTKALHRGSELEIRRRVLWSDVGLKDMEGSIERSDVYDIAIVMIWLLQDDALGLGPSQGYGAPGVVTRLRCPRGRHKVVMGAWA